MRLFVIVLILLFLLPHFPVAHSATPGSSTKSEKVVKIGVDDTIPPYSYLDGGKLTGFNIELLQTMEKYTNFTLKFEPGTWGEVVTWIKNGNIDAVMAMVPTSKRNQSFLFTNVYQQLYFDFFQRASMPQISNINDIENHTVAVIKDDITEYFLKNWMNKTHKSIYLVEVNSAEEGLELLNSNSVDLFLYEMHTSTYYISRLNLKNVRLTNIEAFSMPLAIAVRKSEPWLVEEFNMAMDRVKNSGEYTVLYNKWFNPPAQSMFSPYTYMAIIASVIAVAGITYMTGRYIRSERRIREQRRRIENLQKLSQTLMENMPIGLLYVKNGKCLYANPEAQKILGYSLKEINKYGIFRQIEGEGDTNIKTKNGGHRWIFSKSLDYGRGKIITLMDITDKKLMEIKEKERFEFLNNMLDTLRNPVQNLVFASENMESKDMQEIIKKDIEKIANILKEEPK